MRSVELNAQFNLVRSSCKEEKLEDTASSNITYNNWIEYPQGKLSMQYSGSSFQFVSLSSVS
jgi:hypothetical protein